ncbi:hypothetical protein [Sphingomonas crocodyli]|uniref:Uncharacterized protein n=1 Tax=Sphingomonas crocodyli TaxID=1979270 RepID=A0A437M6W9_9SPHN|nr:hypothetical protein [Sphingomonas crocodyli]RVT93461.1 hypothetical protein EOD43_06180 [Sphingomonas crocodyli]
MMIDTDVQELTDHIVAAARLRTEIAPFESDMTLTRDGGTVFYAVDTNIVLLFLDPKDRGPLRDGLGGFTHIFPSDSGEEGIAEALAAALTRYIIYRTNTFVRDDQAISLPLLLLDGHDAEVRHAYDRFIVRSEGDVEQARTQLNLLKDELEWAVAAENVSERVERIKSSARTLLERLYFDNSHGALARKMGSLLSGGRLARLSVVGERFAQAVGLERSQAIRQAFLPAHDLMASVEENRLRFEWDRRLRAYKKVQGKSVAIDAGALTRLEIVNSKLREHKIRICLITADSSMISACSSYVPEGTDTDFSQLYLRHPRAFLAADEVLTPANLSAAKQIGGNGIMINWLDTLLADLTSDNGPSLDELGSRAAGDNRSLLKERVQQVVSIDNNAIGTLVTDWSAHTQAIQAEHAATSNLAQEELQRTIGQVNFDQLDAALDLVQLALSKESEKTWDDYYRAVVRTGFDLLHAQSEGPGRRRRRMAPAVNFQSFTHARDFVREVIAARGVMRFGPGEIEERLALIEAQGGSYAVLLAYAVLFADDGRWHVALLTAKRAMAVHQIYDRHKKAQDGDTFVPEAVRNRVSGREACYCAAVAQRMMARSLGDFDKSHEYLKRARDALRARDNHLSSPQDTETRFRAEELACSTSRLLFQRYRLKPDTEALARLVVEARRLQLLAFEIAAQARDISDEWSRLVVERSALANLFTLHALDESQVGQSWDETFVQAARRFLELTRSENLTGAFPETDLSKIIGIFAEARFSNPDRNRRRLLSRDLFIFENEMMHDDNAPLMPYDHARYKDLISLSRRALDREV